MVETVRAKRPILESRALPCSLFQLPSKAKKDSQQQDDEHELCQIVWLDSSTEVSISSPSTVEGTE